MPRALEKWIDNSLETLERMEQDREDLSVRLDSAQTTVEKRLEAITRLDQAIASMNAERGEHETKLAAARHQVDEQAGSIDRMDREIECLYGVLDQVASEERSWESDGADVAPTSVYEPVAAEAATREDLPLEDLAAPVLMTSSPDVAPPVSWVRRFAYAAVCVGLVGGGVYAAQEAGMLGTVVDTLQPQLQALLW